MAHRHALGRRSATEWGIRVAIAIALAVLGYASVRQSLAGVARKTDPARAHALAPGDGRIAGLLAERRFSDNADPARQEGTARLARLALQRDATAVEAVATLGLQAQSRNDTARAGQLFAYAQRLSRRDLQTQLWAIEDAVTRNDIPAALRHYDIALSTSKSAPDVLFPVLTGALSETAVREPLVALLARKPSWAPGFIAFAAGSTGDPIAVAAFLQGLARARVPVSTTAQSGVVNNLIVRGSLAEGWRFYASVRPGADRRRSRDEDFSADLETPSVLDWIATNSEGITTTIHDGMAEFGAPPSAGGVLLRQMQLLPPGAYRLDGHSLGIDQAARSLPYWVLSCQDGRELGRVVVPNSVQAKGAFGGRFTVPPGCPVQTLMLIARPSDAITGVSGQIDRVRLAPAR